MDVTELLTNFCGGNLTTNIHDSYVHFQLSLGIYYFNK
jgi:hypothetical protein